MSIFLRCAYPMVLYVGIPIAIVCAWLRLKIHVPIQYVYSLAQTLKNRGFASTHPYKKILYWLRCLMLLVLVLLMSRPQWVESYLKVIVNGIDIVLVLDVSGSMEMPHHNNDKRSRIDVAKEEAVRFIRKRTNDAIGIVVFGKDALSRCPLTADKEILERIIDEIKIGVVDPGGTVLSQSILTAANRLRHSHAKSKIMILLTDGEPSEHDMAPEVAIQAAKQLGIKIYAIGIGADEDIMIPHPWYGHVSARTTLNKPLLSSFARETGGKFFEAKSGNDMRAIYDEIDALEKTEIESPVLSIYHDWFVPLLCCALGLVFLELLLKTFVWFGIYL